MQWDICESRPKKLEAPKRFGCASAAKTKCPKAFEALIDVCTSCVYRAVVFSFATSSASNLHRQISGTLITGVHVWQKRMMKDSRWLVKIEQTATAVLLVSLCSLLWPNSSRAQDADSSPAAGGADGSLSSEPRILDVNRGNPLEKLFTPPNQWSTPQTAINPQPPAPAPGELNALRNLYTPMRQWSTPQTLQNPQAQTPDGEVNHLKNVFTPPNQWSTPQTVLNPQAIPRSFIPERELLWGTEDQRDALLLEHRANTLGSASSPPAVPASGAVFGQTQKLPAAQLKKTQTTAKGTSKAPDSTKTAGKDSTTAATAPSKNGLTVPPPPVSQAAGGEKEDSPLKMSLSLMRSGDNERSLQLLSQIVNRHPEDASARYLKAVALVRMKQYKAAAEEYNEVIRLSPGTRLSTYAREGLTKIGL
jgi:hypothetical protein